MSLHSKQSKYQWTNWLRKAINSKPRTLQKRGGSLGRRSKSKISALERDKARYADQIMHLDNPNRGTNEDKLEPALQIIASPWKLWVSGNITLRRLVLKLAFADRIRYDRNNGARTANLSIPFKALDGVLGGVL